MEPAEDVIHDRLGKADLGVAAPPARLEPRMRKFLAEQLERDSMLQRDRDGQSKAVHEPRDGRAFLGHGDEDFARAAVGIEADSDVAFVSSDLKLVCDGGPLLRQLMPHRSRW